MAEDLKAIKVGGVDDFRNFVNAVIDEEAFNKLSKVIDEARNSPDAEVVLGGEYDKSKGYFIHPTVILAKRPDYVTMKEELFGPILTVYVYNPEMLDETMDLLDSTTGYALTGAIFSTNRVNIERMTARLTHTAGNFYINDKPTGAVVDQQPFGGGRASGTNDKAGSVMNLLRWVSPQCIKEMFVPPTDYMYPNFFEE
jgi:1-pyrroline-5-carboxylate dehydrogenase